MKYTPFILIILLVVSGQGLTQEDVAAPVEPTYIGISKCKLCHKGPKKGEVYEKWQAAAHSGAYQTLVDKGDGSHENAECLSCHTTGFGTSGYLVGDMNAPKFENVQCEMCHGPGSEYKKIHSKDLEAAMKVGFVPKPDENTCKQCHNEKSPTFKGFNFEEFHSKIDHRFRDKAEE